MRLFFAFFLLPVVTTYAQPPQVPHKMQFAGMTLTIRDDARKEIQKDVNALTQSPRHHNIKVERAKTYFPLIEKVFEEERVPDDFKYLALQESALIADAVSTSNAVGFWQFKDFTAVEMGLRVDKEIDERLNIVSSSRAAARYIKKNNFYFNNWIFALQAYQMGAGGAMKSLPKDLSGAKHMEITSSTYWYVKKYIAHKVAFEEAVKGAGQIKAVPYEITNNRKLLNDIAKEVSVSEEELKSYNKWAKKGHIPDDRKYVVIIPVAGEGKELNLPETAVALKEATPAMEAKVASAKPDRIKINGIRAIKAGAAENAAKLASRGHVHLSEFLAWNDISASTPIVPDHYYLLGKKRTKGSEAYHTVGAGETLWNVSQQYGVQMKKLRRYNRLRTNDEVAVGTTLWLSSKKPKDAGSDIHTEETVEVNNTETFAWTADGNQSEASISKNTNLTAPAPVEVTPVVENKVKNDIPTGTNANDSSQTLQPQAVVSMVPDSSVIKSEVVTTTSKGKNHVVQAGETLYAIAHMYNVGVMDLVEWNNLNLQDGIKPGQVLKLSESQSNDSKQQEPKEIQHEVKTTDTLYGIARKYGVTIKELMEWNNKKDFSLAIGEKLKVLSR